MNLFFAARAALGAASCLLLAGAYFIHTEPLLMRAACLTGATWFASLFLTRQTN